LELVPNCRRRREEFFGLLEKRLQLAHQPLGPGEVRSQPRDGTKLLRSN
jgi:hypothetical protein